MLFMAVRVWASSTDFCDHWYVAIINYNPFAIFVNQWCLVILWAFFSSSFSEYIFNNIKVQTITYPTIQDGQTALEQASIKGHHNVVEFFLEAGANPDLQDKVG